jgi:pimeloyl-ACP methyl ester carboxylesterase
MSITHLLVAVLGVLGAAFLLRLAVWAYRERQGFTECGACLRTEWCAIPATEAARSLRIAVRAGGTRQNPPVVLVQGFGIGSGYLVPLAAELSSRMRVYVPDLPGHGASDHDTRPQDIPELAASLGAWMDRAGLPTAVLVGHSLGSQVVVELAVQRPGLVSGLVLLGPTLDPNSRTLVRLLGRAVLTGLFERLTVYYWLLRDYPRAGLRVLRAELRSMLRHQVEDLLPRVAAPVRVVRGTRDAVVPRRWADAVTKLAGAPPPIEISRWAHAVHYDAPRQVAVVVTELVEAIRTGGSINLRNASGPSDPWVPRIGDSRHDPPRA